MLLCINGEISFNSLVLSLSCDCSSNTCSLYLYRKKLVSDHILLFVLFIVGKISVLLYIEMLFHWTLLWLLSLFYTCLTRHNYNYQCYPVHIQLNITTIIISVMYINLVYYHQLFLLMYNPHTPQVPILISWSFKGSNCNIYSQKEALTSYMRNSMIMWQEYCHIVLWIE